MKNDGFSWFPVGVGDTGRVLVFVDAKAGYLLNLDGSIKSDVEAAHVEFCRTFDTRDKALQWAEANAPKNRDVICLLYTSKREEEYVSLGKASEGRTMGGMNKNIIYRMLGWFGKR